MSIHLSETVAEGLPQEPMLLREVRVRLIGPSEQSMFDELLAREHYLKNATVVGQALRYVAEYEGQWRMALSYAHDNCGVALSNSGRDGIFRRSDGGVG